MALVQGVTATGVCVCVHTMGMEDSENRGKEHCLQRLTHKFPPMNPTQHCPIVF